MSSQTARSEHLRHLAFHRPRNPQALRHVLSNPNSVKRDYKTRLQEIQNALDSLPSSVDKFYFISLLKACGELKALHEGKRLHALIQNTGFHNVQVLCHGLISMYGKCGSVENAQTVFNNIRCKNVVSWNSVIGAYIQNGNSKEGLRLFKCMKADGIKPNRISFMTVLNACETLDEGKCIHSLIIDNEFTEDIAVQSALVNMYSKCGDLNLARSVFDKMSVRDVICWNGLITAYAQNGCSRQALEVYNSMLSTGMQPNKITFAVILTACVSNDKLVESKVIHSHIIESGFDSDINVTNAIVNSYGKCQSLANAQTVFDRMPQRDVVSWNTLMLVYAHNGHCRESMRVFEEMHALGVSPSDVSYISILSVCTTSSHLEFGKHIHASAIKHKLDTNILVGNALICMYNNCGSAEDVRDMFEKLQQRSMVSWNAIISAYDHHGLGVEARECFQQMLREGNIPNEYTFASVVSACANTVALEDGKLINSFAIEESCDRDDVVMNALVNLYGRCGSTDNASVVFQKMPRRTIVTWTSIIASYAHQGNGEGALQYFHQMQEEGFEPNEVSFISILSACSHAGCIFEAYFCFSSMCEEYSIIPMAIHYCCIVDLFGRVGRLDLAEWILDEMPFQPHSLEWYTLLCACKSQEDVSRGMQITNKIHELSPEHSAAYVSLSNIYASASTWELG